jgi:site-specific DNA-methyltransferase (adenine-specific)
MNTTGGATIMGSYPYPRNGILEIDYEFILIFKKTGNPPMVTKENKQKSQISKEKWKEYFSGHWYFNGAKQEHHIAMFPVELPRRAIEMFTFLGETVLDPFLGSGTTSLAAMITDRNSIGFEINEDFLPIIKGKLEGNAPLLFKCDVQYRKQELKEFDFKEEINKLPYIFSDPIKFDKKIDPNKLKFGSKISLKDNIDGVRRKEYHSVKEILSTNLIKLNNDLIVRLLGVKPKQETIEKAKQFLEKKIGKGQIFLKFDVEKYDKDNHLLAYVYMKNKTFINAHLIKHGYAKIDLEFQFRNLSKFQYLIKEPAYYEN